MNNSSKIFKLFSDKKIFVYLIILLIVGILLITGSNKKSKSHNDFAEKEFVDYPKSEKSGETSGETSELEKELENILSLADGVGETRVLIKYSTSSEKIPFTDKNNTTLKTTQSNSQGETLPFIAKEISAGIEGVMIVAQGGGNEKIKNEIKNAVSELLGIPIHKVNILKMDAGGN